MGGHRRRKLDQGAFQNIGKDQIKGRGFGQTRMRKTSGLKTFDPALKACLLYTSRCV